MSYLRLALIATALACGTSAAQNAARHFDVPHAFDNVDHLLQALPDIDVVCVSVRPAHHYQVVSAALRAGKHVYCEQPLGISTSQARVDRRGLQRDFVTHSDCFFSTH